jgi:hypothetical protein
MGVSHLKMHGLPNTEQSSNQSVTLKGGTYGGARTGAKNGGPHAHVTGQRMDSILKNKNVNNAGGRTGMKHGNGIKGKKVPNLLGVVHPSKSGGRAGAGYESGGYTGGINTHK